MATKDEKKAKLEEEYAKHLEDIDAEGDDTDDNIEDDDEIVILRGNARKSFLASLESLGLTPSKAEATADKVEESEGDLSGKKKVKQETLKEDPKPPSRSRYFQSRSK